MVEGLLLLFMLGGGRAMDLPEKPAALPKKSEAPPPVNPGDDIPRCFFSEEIKETTSKGRDYFE